MYLSKDVKTGAIFGLKTKFYAELNNFANWRSEKKHFAGFNFPID